MTKCPEILAYQTPDTIAECFNGVSSRLCSALWDLVPSYTDFDREDCGPADVVGVNSLEGFWDRLDADLQAELIVVAERAEKEEAERRAAYEAKYPRSRFI